MSPPVHDLLARICLHCVLLVSHSFIQLVLHYKLARWSHEVRKRDCPCCKHNYLQSKKSQLGSLVRLLSGVEKGDDFVWVKVECWVRRMPRIQFCIRIFFVHAFPNEGF